MQYSEIQFKDYSWISTNTNIIADPNKQRPWSTTKIVRTTYGQKINVVRYDCP